MNTTKILHVLTIASIGLTIGTGSVLAKQLPQPDRLALQTSHDHVAVGPMSPAGGVNPMARTDPGIAPQNLRKSNSIQIVGDDFNWLRGGGG